MTQPRKIRERFLGWLIFGLLTCGGWWLASAAAVAQADKDEQVSVKQVRGTVSAVNGQGIAVELARTETTSQEIYLPFAKGLRLQGVEKVTDLRPGDTVTVEYLEVVAKDGHGERAKLSRLATAVSLASRAPPEQPVANAPEPGSHAPTQTAP